MRTSGAAGGGIAEEHEGEGEFSPNAAVAKALTSAAAEAMSCGGVKPSSLARREAPLFVAPWHRRSTAVTETRGGGGTDEAEEEEEEEEEAPFSASAAHSAAPAASARATVLQFLPDPMRPWTSRTLVVGVGVSPPPPPPAVCVSEARRGRWSRGGGEEEEKRRRCCGRRRRRETSIDFDIDIFSLSLLRSLSCFFLGLRSVADSRYRHYAESVRGGKRSEV